MNEQFAIGAKVTWLTQGYGWSKGKQIPGEVIGYSKTGKRIRIKFQLANWRTNEANGHVGFAYVSPHMLATIPKDPT